MSPYSDELMQHRISLRAGFSLWLKPNKSQQSSLLLSRSGQWFKIALDQKKIGLDQKKILAASKSESGSFLLLPLDFNC
jgi:hypothetical protein